MANFLTPKTKARVFTTAVDNFVEKRPGKPLKPHQTSYQRKPVIF
jgi:hypothetical protein